MSSLKLGYLVVCLAIASGPTALAQNFQRPDHGAPISASERAAATNDFVSILNESKYFDFIESRVHGVPQENSQGRYWWAHMWTGVKVTKKGRQVTYTHQNDGSDNVGIHTAPYLEGACFAYRLSGDPKYAALAQKLIRGFSSWILSSAKSGSDVPRVLSRSFYPASFSLDNDGRFLVVNYEASRPGIHSVVDDYVHIPNNPYFGDLWLKNNRSVDDIGHMLRAISHVQSCRDIFDSETQADLVLMNSLYADWSKTVEEAKFVIPSFDVNAQISIFKGGLGDYNNYSFLGSDPSCTAKLALRFLHESDSQGRNCHQGISELERLFGRFLQNDAIEIIRSNHISAIGFSELRGHRNLAMQLRKGLAERLSNDYRIARDTSASNHFDVQDILAEYIHANNVGVPLTSEEIRFVYERMHLALLEIRRPENFSTFHLFDSVVGDGSYSFDPPNRGVYFYTFGPMIGSCSSAWAQTSVRPLFDCEKVKAALKENQSL